MKKRTLFEIGTTLLIIGVFIIYISGSTYYYPQTIIDNTVLYFPDAGEYQLIVHTNFNVSWNFSVYYSQFEYKDFHKIASFFGTTPTYLSFKLEKRGFVFFVGNFNSSKMIITIIEVSHYRYGMISFSFPFLLVGGVLLVIYYSWRFVWFKKFKL